MNYIYDIVLNFNKDYFEFFEWKKKDRIINIKKIPAFKVSSDILRDLKYNDIRVSNNFLEEIYELTSFYSKVDYKYLCLFSDSNEAIGVIFDKDGFLKKRSILIFEEENEFNEISENEAEILLKFVDNIHKDLEYITRVEKERKNYLVKFISSLDEVKDEIIFKYIYYDYFEVEEENIKKIKIALINKINNNFDITRIYNLVKVFRKIRN